MNESSRPYIERASRGDRAAVDSLLTLHLPELRRYLERHQGALLGARESASDLVQSTCREILSHLDRYRYRGDEEFRRWLFATAVRKLRSRRRFWQAARRDARRVDEPPRDSESAALRISRALAVSSTPSQAAMHQEAVAGLQAALEKLPERYRMVLDLAVGQGLSLGEVAQRLGLTEANARMLKSRAIARLATLVEKQGGG